MLTLTWLIVGGLSVLVLGSPYGRRVVRIARGWADAGLERLENPERSLERLGGELDARVHDAEVGVTRAVVEERRLTKQLGSAQDEARAWYLRAEQAIADGDEPKAREALVRAAEAEKVADTLQGALAEIQGVVAGLRQRLAPLRMERDAKRRAYAMLIARSKVGRARAKVLGRLDPDAARLEARIEDDVLMADVLDELAIDSTVADFSDLDQRRIQAKVDAHLEALKARKRLSAGGEG